MAVTRGRGSRRRLETAETPLLPLLAALCRSLPRTRRKIASLLSVGTVFEPEGRGFEPLPEPTRALLGCSQIDCETRRCPRGVPLGPVGCDFAPPKDHLAAVTATSIARASAPRRP